MWAHRYRSTDRLSGGRLLINVVTGGDTAELEGDGLFVDHDTTEWLQLPGYDDANTKAALAGSGIACAEVDAQLMRRYVERFVVSGYVRRP